MKYYILYNPIAGSGKCDNKAEKLSSRYGENGIIFDMTKITDYNKFFSNIEKEDKIVICGGDGTLNRFVNDIKEIDLNKNIYYFPGGSGNDFFNDVDHVDENGFIKVNKYLNNLPCVYMGDKKQFFINGIGYGVDGYCCQETNKLKLLGKKANYALIALKGLLFVYKPTNAVVTVDGEKFKYNRVWLASTMLGKFFGGGIKIAPMQDRTDKEGKISLIIAHNLGKINIMRLFPSIFKGNHIKYKEYIAVHNGYDITVEFDRPTVMQIDGETGDIVSKYRVIKSNKEALV